MGVIFSYGPFVYLHLDDISSTDMQGNNDDSKPNTPNVNTRPPVAIAIPLPLFVLFFLLLPYITEYDLVNCILLQITGCTIYYLFTDT